MNWKDEKGNLTWPAVFCIMVIISCLWTVMFGDLDNDKCAISYCDNEATYGDYCYVHDYHNNTTSSRPKCAKAGCNSWRAYGSSYCYTHKETSKTGTSSSGYKPSSGNTGYKPSGGNTAHKPYDSLNCDPADYDTPDDYADDAWGDDFDDWDDAYDYWEEY